MKNVEIIFRKFYFLIRFINIKRSFLFLNFSAGYTTHPVNSLASHQIFFCLNYPQKVNGMSTFRGINLVKSWGSRLDKVKE